MTAEALSELLHKPLFTVSLASFYNSQLKLTSQVSTVSNDPAALDK